MKLTPRLLNIAKFVPKNSVLADVGTDHGYIPVYLMKNKITEKIIATDINEGPLLSAQKNIKLYGLDNYIETRLGNGLEAIQPGEVDTVIIAGMGGLLIRDILLNHPDVTKSIKRFILQPMVAQDELRRWLYANNFKIIDEKLVSEDHRIYEIIVVEHGKEVIEDEIYFEIGKKLIENKDPHLEAFIYKHIKKQKDIINNLVGQKTDKAKNKLKECKEKIEKFEEVLRWLKN
ncbi:tRNA (adenine(22)-N(1))-methyltransferase [Crassaminicella indica]|uniref:tRNA (Adenine(22)-N(1))-methyltransferase TrmK n=1 Tax=Crassaminicella indica TaxID=2855394 RepID=A0ABX8RB97_9CLOT|nr:class I SAM-dependent methyltransferase [Crassaminicella indica]QXM05717.1 tRNA (adenine(22)-N(1))-methyltransferase TrmK [Crassaminicella indica]